MEFDIDFPTVTTVTSQEYELARADIEKLGVLPAYKRSLQRHDERLAAAPDAKSLACRAGCSWCCYFSVDVRPVEVFNILEFMERELPPTERERIHSEIAINSLLLDQLSEVERAQRNIKCPFLAVGRCTIYAVRPQTCRNYHATDAAGCKKSFEEPENLDIDPDFAPLTYQIGGSQTEAFSEAMKEAGYDAAAYELNTALAAAMQNAASARERFESKQPPFAGLKGGDVPPEFMAIDE